jgi:hypothetical protein
MTGTRRAVVLDAPGPRDALQIEVELAQKSIARLRAILELHASWRAAGKSAGVIYICADEAGCARIRKRAAEYGLRPGKGGGFRVEPLETVKAATVAAFVHDRRRSELRPRSLHVGS